MHKNEGYERAPVKAKILLTMAQRKAYLRRVGKRLSKKDILDRDLKRRDSQDHAVWRLGFRNWFIPVSRKTNGVLKRQALSTLLEQIDYDVVAQ